VFANVPHYRGVQARRLNGRFGNSRRVDAAAKHDITFLIPNKHGQLDNYAVSHDLARCRSLLIALQDGEKVNRFLPGGGGLWRWEAATPSRRSEKPVSQ
jgi:hypothetical protein